jgi:hypothetical protein
MQAIEFQTIAHNRYIRVPDEIPDGIEMRVLFLIEELEKTIQPAEAQKFEQLQVQLGQAEQDMTLGRYVELDKAGVAQLFADLKQRIAL